MSSAELDAIIEALAYLLCTEDTGEKLPWRKPQIEAFDGFEVLDERLWAEDDFILMGKSAADQPVWPLRVVTACRSSQEYVGGWQFTRWKTLSMNDWRGRLRYATPKMLEVSILHASPAGLRTGETLPLAIINGKAIRATASDRISTAGGGGYMNPSYFGRTDNDWTTLACLTAGFALRHRYNWNVFLGEGNSPRARFLTDSTGVKEVFRLRDIPPGRKRRAALLHWVKEHWRKRRQDSELDKIMVREHMRGAEQYVWNGLRCEIVPSQEDLERAGRRVRLVEESRGG